MQIDTVARAVTIVAQAVNPASENALEQRSTSTVVACMAHTLFATASSIEKFFVSRAARAWTDDKRFDKCAMSWTSWSR